MSDTETISANSENSTTETKAWTRADSLKLKKELNRQAAEALAGTGIKTLSDSYENITLWGVNSYQKNLFIKLQEITKTSTATDTLKNTPLGRLIQKIKTARLGITTKKNLVSRVWSAYNTTGNTTDQNIGTKLESSFYQIISLLENQQNQTMTYFQLAKDRKAIDSMVSQLLAQNEQTDES